MHYENKRYVVIDRPGYFRNIRSKFSQFLMHLLNPSKAQQYFSPSLWPTYSLFERDCQESDIVHLHWVQGEFINSNSILSLKCPVVWTLHDMWPILGFQHYPSNLTFVARIIENWCLGKKDLAHQNILFHCTTAWMESQVKKRYRNCNTVVIPYPIDTNVFKPRENTASRKAWGLPSGTKTVLFGAIGGISDYRKGWDLLREAIDVLAHKNNEFILVVFGGDASEKLIEIDGIRVYNAGIVTSEERLSYLYSASDVMVVPSRIEAYGQTAAEAISCGVPVIAFDNSGLADIVEHGKTGFLAKSFSPVDLAKWIDKIISNDSLGLELSKNCRRKSEDDWSYNKISAAWINTYKNILQY